jgi:putative SOS response-associated peptidase YedK
MCYHVRQLKTREELEDWYDASFRPETYYQPSIFNGFEHPDTPVITNRDTHLIDLYSWGLMPTWAKDSSFRKNTLNAQIETVAEKPSFRDLTGNRCLVLIDGFYEWQWLDAKGKIKQKYFISLPAEVPFALAGLYNTWTDRNSGEMLNTFTILTTEANALMAEIHNTKKRMPVVLSKEQEKYWLKGENHLAFAVPEVELIANKH